MSLTSAMYNAGTGLSAVSRYTDLVSNNIANAQTEGYSRVDLEVSSQVLSGRGAGVDKGIVVRAADAYLTNALRESSSASAKQEAINDILSYFNNELGDVTTSGTVAGFMDSFVESLRDLAESPESSALQENVVLNAQSLIREINLLSTNVQTLRKEVDNRIKNQVTDVNNSLEKLKQLNEDIVQRQSLKIDVTALLDQRDQVLSDISQFIAIKVTPTYTGSVNVYTAEGGVPLYENAPLYLTFGSAFGVSATSVYAADTSTVVSPYVANLSGITIQNGTQTIDITPTGNLSTSFDTGSLAGLFELRDTILPEAQNQLDAIASGLIQSMRETDATAGATDDSLFTTTSGYIDLSVAGNEVGVAQKLTLNSAFDSLNGGTASRLRDGVNAVTQGPRSEDDQIRAFIDALTTDRAFSADSGLDQSQSVLAAAADFLTRQVNGIEAAKNEMSAAQTRYQVIQDTRDNLLGVNLDEETQKLTMLSQLYSANATVIDIVAQMFADLLEAV